MTKIQLIKLLEKLEDRDEIVMRYQPPVNHCFDCDKPINDNPFMETIRTGYIEKIIDDGKSIVGVRFVEQDDRKMAGILCLVLDSVYEDDGKPADPNYRLKSE